MINNINSPPLKHKKFMQVLTTLEEEKIKVLMDQVLRMEKILDEKKRELRKLIYKVEKR